MLPRHPLAPFVCLCVCVSVRLCLCVCIRLSLSPPLSLQILTDSLDYIKNELSLKEIVIAKWPPPPEVKPFPPLARTSSLLLSVVCSRALCAPPPLRVRAAASVARFEAR